MSSILDRLAGAPISWGVCEAPGWGYEIEPDRVLAEMRAVGMTATELGPAGYLGDRPAQVAALLADRGLRLIGGFVPVVLHTDPAADLTEAKDAIAILAAGGAEIVVLAARSADGSYDSKVPVSDEQWPVLVANLDRVQQLARDAGLLPALHPHVGTAIESRESVLRLLDSSDVALCLDTGHLLIGGTQPLELVKSAGGRIAHVHLKDVNAALAAQVSGGERDYMSAVQAGLYTPLGDGDIDIAAVVTALEDAGYQGWYVLEQDCALPGEPAAGAGPISDVRRSLDFLAALAI